MRRSTPAARTVVLPEPHVVPVPGDTAAFIPVVLGSEAIFAGRSHQGLGRSSGLSTSSQNIYQTDGHANCMRRGAAGAAASCGSTPATAAARRRRGLGTWLDGAAVQISPYNAVPIRPRCAASYWREGGPRQNPRDAGMRARRIRRRRAGVGDAQGADLRAGDLDGWIHTRPTRIRSGSCSVADTGAPAAATGGTASVACAAARRATRGSRSCPGQRPPARFACSARARASAVARRPAPQ